MLPPFMINVPFLADTAHGNCATRAGNYSAAAVAAAGDDAAGDGLIAVFIQFPQAVVVRELVVFSGVAVDDGQLV